MLPTATACTSYSACFASLATEHSTTAARPIAAEAAAAAAAVSAVCTAGSTDAARATATAACTLPGAQLHVRRRTMRRSDPRPLAFALVPQRPRYRGSAAWPHAMPPPALSLAERIS